ncbi:hypothetical protein D3C87_36260 [compost metagenome]
MKKILSGLFKYHLIPIILSILLIYCLNAVASRYIVIGNAAETEIVSGVAVSERGMFNNCTKKQAEIELMGSLQDKSKLSVFGSSELQDLPYSCFLFLPDSMGIKTTGFGHAYHQNLSIACELLAAGDKLNGANVCVILSPGWFESEGTNIEAFLEFVRPNFIRSIVHNPSIPKKDKLHIANYVHDHFSDINDPSNELIYLNSMSMYENKKWIPNTFEKYSLQRLKKVEYRVTSKKTGKKTPFPVDWELTKNRLQQEFLKTCTNNSIYVDSFYYTTYLLKDGKFSKSKMDPVELGDEFNDFKLVVEILKRHHCNATFVLQPLNPYNYDDLSQFDHVRSQIKSELKKAGFPLLDMYVTNTKEYTPGILKDIMHPSNRGWMEINAFLTDHYKKLYE